MRTWCDIRPVTTCWGFFAAGHCGGQHALCSSWLARPQDLRWPGPLLMQPLSARCTRVRMGAHSLQGGLDRRTGALQAKWLCQRCGQHAVGEERHTMTSKKVVVGTHQLQASLPVSTLADCMRANRPMTF